MVFPEKLNVEKEPASHHITAFEWIWSRLTPAPSWSSSQVSRLRGTQLLSVSLVMFSKFDSRWFFFFNCNSLHKSPKEKEIIIRAQDLNTRFSSNPANSWAFCFKAHARWICRPKLGFYTADIIHNGLIHYLWKFVNESWIVKSKFSRLKTHILSVSITNFSLPRTSTNQSSIIKTLLKKLPPGKLILIAKMSHPKHYLCATYHPLSVRRLNRRRTALRIGFYFCSHISFMDPWQLFCFILIS